MLYYRAINILYCTTDVILTEIITEDTSSNKANISVINPLFNEDFIVEYNKYKNQLKTLWPLYQILIFYMILIFFISSMHIIIALIFNPKLKFHNQNPETSEVAFSSFVIINGYIYNLNIFLRIFISIMCISYLYEIYISKKFYDFVTLQKNKDNLENILKNNIHISNRIIYIGIALVIIIYCILAYHFNLLPYIIFSSNEILATCPVPKKSENDDD